MKNLLVILGLGLSCVSAIAQTRLTDINISGSSTPMELTAIGDNLYFGATDFVNGYEPYKLDTAGNVTLISDILPGVNSSSPQGFAESNGGVYFLAAPSLGDMKMYKYDSNGLMLILSSGFENTFQLPQNHRLTSYDGGIIVSHDDNSFNIGTEPYFYDGSSNALQLLMDINPNLLGSAPSEFFEWNGVMYFAATNDTYGRELWSFDGISVTRLTDMAAGQLDGLPNMVTVATPRFKVFNDHLYFSANSGATNQFGLYKYDGINSPVLASADSNYRVINGFFEVNNKLVLTAMDTNFQSHLYTYDEVNQEQFLSDTLMFKAAVYNDKILFTRSEIATGRELWECDGITAPHIVADLNPGAGSSVTSMHFSNFNLTTIFEDKFYFNGDDGQSGTELWAYDGVNPPCQITDFPLETFSPYYLTVFHNDLYFTGNDGVYGTEIWKLNGEPLGVDNLTPIEINVFPNPTTDYVQIETDEEIKELQITDMMGKVVYNATNPSKKIDLSTLATGTYIINLVLENRQYSETVVISAN